MASGIRGGGAAAPLAPPPQRKVRYGRGAACLASPPQTIKVGDAAFFMVRSAVIDTRRKGPGLVLRVPSPYSRLRWPLLCLPDPPREEEHLINKEEENGEAWDALKAMVVDIFRPLLRNLADIRSVCTIYDLEDYQLGMFFGAVLGCVGCYQLWKAAPSIFIDVALAYLFYKLSVLSSEVRRQGKCNELFTRLKFGIVVIMAVKEFRKKHGLLDILRIPVFAMYLGTFVFDITSMKKYGKHYLIRTVDLLKTKGGLQELFKIMFYPGYVSPYDDRFHRK